MTVKPASAGAAGLEATLRYPLFRAIAERRSRRVSQGVRSIPAGSLTYRSTKDPEPLSSLEEAPLIAATGTTGWTMPDAPFETEDGRPLVGSPMLEVRGRAASSPDNAQATHFFLINDTGVYFLKQLEPEDGERTAERIVAQAERAKVQVLDRRLDLPRHFPAYVGRNRYLSNVPGSTILVPVVDMTRQYINGIMYLLSQEDGRRPTFIDDWNFYRPAGVRKWIRSGFLNKKHLLPLGYLGTFRIHVEADLLMQNLMLAGQAMGLGAWIHAAFAGPYLLGDPAFRDEYGPGLGFRYARPRTRLRSLFRFLSPLPSWRPNPVGKDGVIEGYCPPYYPSMDAAVDAILAEKYGPRGLYADAAHFQPPFKPGLAERFVEEVPHYEEEVLAVARAVCNYIYDTYDRFPAHVDAMYVPGVWVQFHHLDPDYYDQLFTSGYSESHARHAERWH